MQIQKWKIGEMKLYFNFSPLEWVMPQDPIVFWSLTRADCKEEDKDHCLLKHAAGHGHLCTNGSLYCLKLQMGTL